MYIQEGSYESYGSGGYGATQQQVPRSEPQWGSDPQGQQGQQGEGLMQRLEGEFVEREL